MKDCSWPGLLLMVLFFILLALFTGCAVTRLPALVQQTNSSPPAPPGAEKDIAAPLPALFAAHRMDAKGFTLVMWGKTTWHQTNISADYTNKFETNCLACLAIVEPNSNTWAVEVSTNFVTWNPNGLYVTGNAAACYFTDRNPGPPNDPFKSTLFFRARLVR